MRVSALFGLALAGLLLAACKPDLGTCDDAAARTIVYDPMGLPYYAGQAQIIASCNLCHLTGMGDMMTVGDSRHGAPHNLNWDLALAGSDTASTDRLRAGQDLTYQFRYDIWSQVSGGSMPPIVGGMDSATNVTMYNYPDGRLLESLRDSHGRDILKNWLACGTPVIERTPDHPRPPGEDPIGLIAAKEGCLSDMDCQVSSHTDAFFCDLDLHQCELHPTWASIYAGFVQPGCAVTGCHADGSGPPPPPPHISGLFLSPTDAMAARTALVGQASTSPACGPPAIRVDPMHPESSLMLAKLIGHYYGTTTPVCGPIMPYGSMTPYDESDKVFVQPIHDWIAAGALP